MSGSQPGGDRHRAGPLHEHVARALRERCPDALAEPVAELVTGRPPCRAARFVAGLCAARGTPGGRRAATAVEALRLYGRVRTGDRRRLLLGNALRTAADRTVLEGPWPTAVRLAAGTVVTRAGLGLARTLGRRGGEGNAPAGVDPALAEPAGRLAVVVCGLAGREAAAVRAVTRRARREGTWRVPEDARPASDPVRRAVSRTREDGPDTARATGAAGDSGEQHG